MSKGAKDEREKINESALRLIILTRADVEKAMTSYELEMKKTAEGKSLFERAEEAIKEVQTK